MSFFFHKTEKIPNDINITKEIVEEVYQLFKAKYTWKKPKRSISVRGADLVVDTFPEQLDLFMILDRGIS